MDIRSFFKPAPGRASGGARKPAAAAKPEPAQPQSQSQQQQLQSQPQQQQGSQPKAPAAKAPAASPAGAGASPPKGGTPSGSAGDGLSPQQPAAAGTGSRKRKKKQVVVDSSDSDVAIVSDGSSEPDDDDDDFDAMDLEPEAAEDMVDLLDDDSDAEPKPKPAKRAKPSPAAAAAAKPAAKPAAAKGGAAGAAAKKKAPAKRGKKADRPEMVVDRTPKGSQEAKRKLPGSMSGKTATMAAAPKAKKAAKVELSVEAQKAVKRTERAAAELPELDVDTLDFAPPALYGGVPQDREPPCPDSKEVVHGHPDAFSGRAFVFTGTLPSLYRDKAKDLVLSHGGRVTGDVSSRTAFLVIGEQASRRKYDKALEYAGKGCKVIDEDGLLALAAATADMRPQTQTQDAAPSPSAAAAAAAAAGAGAGAATPSGAAGAGASPTARGAVVPAITAVSFYGGADGAAPRLSPAGAAALARSRASGGAGAGAGGAGGGNANAEGVDDQLWVDKYKPRSAAELVGNTGVIATLRQWLYQWDDVHLRGATPQQPRGTSSAKDMGKKAVLLTGPPGIGKTSAAHIIAHELGFSPFEVNASDARGKSDAQAKGGIAGKMSNLVREMVTSTALAGAGGTKRRPLLIMDEVDGMSAGDRGGVADLILSIKRSKVPIVAIANDKYAQKLKSLRNHCLELDFRKPTAAQVAGRMALVCRAEGLAANDASLRAVAEGAQADLRLVLGQLQMARRRAASLDYGAAKALSGASKDADMSPFAAVSKLFEPTRQADTAHPPSIADKLELVFVDAGLVPLMVAENYVNYAPDLTRNGHMGMRLRALAKAADAISVGDVVDRSVRRHNQWSLMPFGALMSGVTPATYMRGARSTFEAHEQNFTRFSSWFGANSHAGKQQRLLGELSCAMAAGDTGATVSRSSVRLDYIPALRQVLTVPLAREQEGGIPQVLATMQSYCISRDAYDYVLDVSKWKKGRGPSLTADPVKDVATKTKSAFTRAFNKEGLKPRTAAMVPEVGARKGRGRGKAAGGGAAAYEVEEQEGVAADVEGGAALAEEAPAPGGPQRAEQQEEEEELSPEQLAAQLRGEGISFKAREGKPKASGGRGGGRSGRGGGRSGGRAGSGGGRSGAGRGSGGRGRGRGK